MRLIVVRLLWAGGFHDSDTSVIEGGAALGSCVTAGQRGAPIVA